MCRCVVVQVCTGGRVCVRGVIRCVLVCVGECRCLCM